MFPEERRGNFFSAATVLLVLLTIGISLVLLRNAFTPLSAPRTTANVPAALRTPAPALEAQVAALQQQLKALQARVDEQLIAAPTPSTSGDTDLDALRAQVAVLDQRLSVMERDVLDDPGKALELTLLRRDLNDLRAAQQTWQAQNSQDIERVYNQNGWFLGLMFTMALGLLSLAVGSFVRRPTSPLPPKNPEGRGVPE